MNFVLLGEVIKPAKTILAGNKEYPLLSMTMREGLVPPEQKFKKRVASEDTSGYKVVKEGQLVVGFPIDEGVLSFQNTYNEAIVSPAYGVWDIKIDNVDSRYLEMYLKSPSSISYYIGKLRSTTARRRSLDRDSFLNLPVPLPPLEEQERIAGILDQADALRRLRARALEKLNTLGQAVFQEMFGGSAKKSFPSVSLGQIIKVSSGRGLTASAMEGGGYPVYGGNGINGWHSEGFVPPETIVIGRVGAYCGAVHVTKKKSWVTDNALIVAKLLDINTYYLLYALQDLSLNQHAGRAAQPLISGGRIYPLEIGLPDLTMQKRFAQILVDIECRVAVHLRAKEACEDVFASLQSAAFQGRL